jgi:hypothetical protein
MDNVEDSGTSRWIRCSALTHRKFAARVYRNLASLSIHRTFMLGKEGLRGKVLRFSLAGHKVDPNRVPIMLRHRIVGVYRSFIRYVRYDQ